MVRHSFKTGLTFGLTSGIITTLGLMVGLHSGTHSRAVVIGGIITIAIADAFSDALGVHFSEESENRHNAREIWEATLATFLAKFFMASTFLIPVWLLDLSAAIMVSVAWGLSLLSVASYLIARDTRARPWKVILEHLAIAVAVIFLAHLVGDWVRENLR